MLAELFISNIAIIKNECICPSASLTVLTGETGAGKSIIIDSVGLIMGERAYKELLRTGEEKATVSALFRDIGQEAAETAKALGIETEDGTLLLQRDITDKGGSIARINGRTVPLAIMREIAEKLISIPLGELIRSVVRQSVGLHLFLGKICSYDDGHFLHLQLLRCHQPGMTDDDDIILVHDYRLSKTKLLDGCGYLFHRFLRDVPRVLLVGYDIPHLHADYFHPKTKLLVSVFF